MVIGERDVNNFIKLNPMLETVGKYDIPVLKGIRMKDNVTVDFIGLNEAHTVPKSKRSEKIVHHFLADYLFERVWSRLEDNTEYLKQFKAVLSPDFSLYTDMPLALQIFNHYKKMAVSQY